MDQPFSPTAAPLSAPVYGSVTMAALGPVRMRFGLTEEVFLFLEKGK